MPNDVRFMGHGISKRQGRMGESSNDAERIRTRLNYSNSVHNGITEIRRYNKKKLELELIRRKWRLQQQRMELHQRRKEIFIKEYEIRQEHRLKQLNGSSWLFKGPEGTQINPTELRKIKVDIYRNVPGESAANELQREIVNPEDVVVKRRAGEGSKPIFEREELAGAVSNTEELEEHRRVATVKDADLENKPQASKRRSASLNLTRNRSQSHRRTSSRHSRHEDYKHDERENRRSHGNRGRSRNRSRERKDRRRTQSCYVGDKEIRFKERRSRDHSRSRERDQAKWDRDSNHSSKSIRGRSGERRMPSQQVPVIGQLPIPIYYGNFPPRPVLVGPLVPFRGQVVFGGSGPLMWPIRPFGSRFPPGIDMYRLRPPGNPRGFGPKY